MTLFLPILPPALVVFETFRASDFFGKIIVMGLLGVSVWVWAVMILKGRELRAAYRADIRFRKAFMGQGHPFALYMEGRVGVVFRGSPLARIYEACCDAARREFAVAAARRGDVGAEIVLSREHLTGPQIDSIRKAGECEAADQILLMEEQMGLLASSYTIAPMLGLFGTVWGVMVTFHSMGGEGMANLASVAPGISSAMLTTIVGLVVAIPTAAGSNALNQKIRFNAIQMDNFTDKFAALLQQSFRRE